MGMKIERIVGAKWAPLAEKALAGERLSLADGLELSEAPLNSLGALANLVREKRHGSRSYFVRNQHINYTNICNKLCKFCSFYAKKGGPSPYEMSLEEVRKRLLWHVDAQITEVHIVGGINVRLPYEYYLDVIRLVKETLPGVQVKAFTMIEIEQIANKGQVSIEQALADLQAAGLDSLPGGGIEVLSDRVHKELFGRKLNGDGWKRVARAAASLGIPQYATMLYGHVETERERIEHFVQLRELQDETKNFLSFTPLCFHPEQTELSHLAMPTAELDLRMIALSRLMLDNFEHIKSFWIMNTPPVTQVAQWYGADDLDGFVHEYEITYGEGAFGQKKQVLDYEAMVGMIRSAGREPVERDSLYQIVDRSAREPALA